MTRQEKIAHLLTRGVVGVIEKKHLEAALRGRKRLRVKHGIDPTGKKVHIGRAVVLWKLREFQELGHQIVIIIGDFTAQIGDSSDKPGGRPMLTSREVQANLRGYLPQIGKILNLKKTEIRYNSEWLSKPDFQKIGELADIFTVQQLIERRNFRERWDRHKEIRLRELLYPLMQAYDSVAVRADVELGGTDQLFNLLAGRKVQVYYGQKPQDVMTTEMLMGLDGREMSTTWGNVINITDPPDEQYGKIMSLRDELIIDYLRLSTDVPERDIAQRKRALGRKSTNPKNIKEELARAVVARYHGEAEAQKAAARFDTLFSRRQMTKDVAPLSVSKKRVSALELVMLSNTVRSNSEARRLITQGGFKVDAKAVTHPIATLSLRGGEVLKIGKKRFFRVQMK